jgi:DNA phosphorothioation-dependent restriction protein DptH
VEWREDKAEAVLLLVDTANAGAGMDGIYSAAREIVEAELFAKAKLLAREKLPHGSKGFADKALSKARRLARNKALSPVARVRLSVPRKQRPGKSRRGLAGDRPVAGGRGRKPDDEDLEKSARLVERLLARQGNRQSAEARAAGLHLPAADAAVERELAEFLRTADSLSRLDALARLDERRSLVAEPLAPRSIRQPGLAVDSLGELATKEHQALSMVWPGSGCG